MRQNEMIVGKKQMEKKRLGAEEISDMELDSNK